MVGELHWMGLGYFSYMIFCFFVFPSNWLFLFLVFLNSSSLKSDLYKPQFAGFVDVDLAADKKISLRSLVCANSIPFGAYI